MGTLHEGPGAMSALIDDGWRRAVRGNEGSVEIMSGETPGNDRERAELRGALGIQGVKRMANEVVAAPLAAGGRVAAIIPQTMEEVWRIATAVCKAGMAPRGMDTPEQCTIAIMHGLEIGLTPMQALQRIAIVNGRPTLWGDGAMALVRGSGLCESIEETIDGDGDSMTARCCAIRRGQTNPIWGMFSVADAKRARLWNKAGPWQQFPKRMLAMRARAFCLRDGFADVLGGMYLKEEMDNDGRDARLVEPPRNGDAPAVEREPESPGLTADGEFLESAASAPGPEAPAPEPHEIAAAVAALTEAAASGSMVSLGKVWNGLSKPLREAVGGTPRRDEFMAICERAAPADDAALDKPAETKP